MTTFSMQVAGETMRVRYGMPHEPVQVECDGEWVSIGRQSAEARCKPRLAGVMALEWCEDYWLDPSDDQYAQQEAILETIEIEE
jgi:hypothetical protein